MKTKPISVYVDGGSRNTGFFNHTHISENDKSACAYYMTNVIDGRAELKGKYYLGKTNQCMEISAVVMALSDLAKLDNLTKKVVIYTDSKYVFNGINDKWYEKWSKNDWHTKSGNAVKNIDQWQQVSKLVPKFNFSIQKVKAHAKCNNNNIVDKLVNRTMNTQNDIRESRFI